MPARFFAAGALLLSLAAAAYWAFADSYSTESCSSSAGGPMVCTTSTSTLIEENGSWVILLLLLPICLATAQLLLVLAHAGGFAKGLVAVLFVGFSVVSIFSLGLFFLPAAILTVAAAVAADQSASQPA